MTKLDADIYEKFDAAFNTINAFAVIRKADCQQAGLVAFKRSNQSGMVTCFAHIFGLPMVKGRAGGGGYDKHTASFHDAMAKLESAIVKGRSHPHSGQALQAVIADCEAVSADYQAFLSAAQTQGESSMQAQFDKLGYFMARGV